MSNPIISYTFWILVNKCSKILGVIPQLTLCLLVPPSMSPSMVCVFPLPVYWEKPIIFSDHNKSISFSCSKQEQVQIKHKIYYTKNFTIITVLEYTLIIQSNAKQTNWNNKSTRAGASKPMTHLTISKHAAVVASHAIFYHWQTSYFKEILLSYQSCKVWEPTKFVQQFQQKKNIL